MRSQFDVSTEAVLIRLAQMSERPCAAFVASRVERGTRAGPIPSRLCDSFPILAVEAPAGSFLPDQSVVQECTAIGYTAKGDQPLPGLDERVHFECVGIPPYPGSFNPRVAGLMSSATTLLVLLPWPT